MKNHLRSPLLALGVLLAASLAGIARADTVIFKDGFVLQGAVRRETEVITDAASGQVVGAPKGPFFVVDGFRQFSFSYQQVQDVEKKDSEQAGEIVKVVLRTSRISPIQSYPITNIVSVTSWDKKWERTFTIRTFTNGGIYKIPIVQRMGLLTPQFARVDARNYNWSEYYATLELGVADVRELLENHPDFKMKGDKSDIERRFKLARFLRQAGWYKQSGEELDKLLKQFPDEKQNVTNARTQLKDLELLQAVDDLEAGQTARRHRWLQKQLSLFPKDDVPPTALARVRAPSTKYDFLNDALRESVTFLKELTPRLKEPATKAMFQEATEKILEELNEDNVGRLETFLTFARQTKREGEKEQTPEQLLALAVSGWLLGKESAETKPETAERLWLARALLLKYLNAPAADARDNLLAEYQARKDKAVAFDELAQIVNNLPPIDPPVLTSVSPFELTATTFSGKKNGLPYLVQMPLEYHPGRAYPVLFVLHQVGEGPKDMIGRLSAMAARYGYILVAPDWTGGRQQLYQFSPEEHAAVVNVLKDLRRRFQVDSDRVFLLGAGEGGAMAFDVGLAHPDLFAGVLPVSAGLQNFSLRYGTNMNAGNAQNLPFYVVSGTHAGKEMPGQIRDLFRKKWVPQGFPGLHVEYNGRGLEWFPAELAPMFDWMNRKKRATAYPTCGRFDYLTLRDTDNSYYWLTAEALRSGATTDYRAFNNRVLGATMHGRIAEGNQVVVQTRGVQKLSVWLSRDAVDLSKPVVFRVNGGATTPRLIKPDIKTMLEDLYQRGDRQHLFVAKESFELK